MRKKIEHKLEYREEGESRELLLEIDFSSNRVIRDFSELLLQSSEVEKAHNRISDIYTELASENITEEKEQKLSQEIEKCNNIILSFNDNGHLDKRFNILKTLLIDNGYKDNKKLMSIDFWDGCVEPGELLFFMYKAIYKDISSKKKVIHR